MAVKASGLVPPPSPPHTFSCRLTQPGSSRTSSQGPREVLLVRQRLGRVRGRWKLRNPSGCAVVWAGHWHSDAILHYVDPSGWLMTAAMWCHCPQAYTEEKRESGANSHGEGHTARDTRHDFFPYQTFVIMQTQPKGAEAGLEHFKYIHDYLHTFLKNNKIKKQLTENKRHYHLLWLASLLPTRMSVLIL